ASRVSPGRPAWTPAGAAGGNQSPACCPPRNREEEPVRSARRRRPGPAAPEAFLVEDLALAQQVVDRPPQACRQDGQAAPLAVLLLLALQPRLGARALAHDETRCLGEGPAQMRVADLPRPRALLFAGRLVGAAHQPAVRQELAGRGEAAD